MRALLVLVTTACLSACSNDTVCAGTAVPAVEVTVLDSLTGERRERESSVLVYSLDKGGILVDSVRGVRDAEPIRAALDQAGLLRTVVQHAGYVTWTRASLKVNRERGWCDVITEPLLVRLQRAEQ